MLHKIIGIKYLDNSNEENSFRIFYNYDKFGKCINPKDDNLKYFYWSWIDVQETSAFHWNKNLELQKGCFLLFESVPWQSDNIKKSFEWMLEYFESVSGKKYKEPILTIYNIPYKSIFKEDLKDDGSLYNGSLYEFMEDNKKLGKYLFNDIQGLKYDIQFRLSVM